jgi:predicted transcriptional regulator of viral defense system
MPRASTLGALADLSEEQWGLFTRRQAEETGMAWSTLARLAAAGVVERVAHGVYRLRGAPPADHLDLRAAWLQLAPDTPAWRRTAEAGVISHRCAASLYGLGHLPADVHEFTLPARRQSRRDDVRLHQRRLDDAEWTARCGLPVTCPSRTAADLLADREDPAAVGHVIADALRGGYDYPQAMADAVAPYAARFGLRRGDGLALLAWLLELSGADEREQWLKEATSEQPRRASDEAAP